MGHEDHRRQGPASVAIALLTISDTRTPATDESGALARRILEAAGHAVRDHDILPDEPEAVRAWVVRHLADGSCDGVITCGGTGISPRDLTHEALAQLLDRPLPGFGELFRALSYEEIGSAAMLSRAVGGIASGRLLFCIPGSKAAVALALEKLIVPELGHLAAELRKGGT